MNRAAYLAMMGEECARQWSDDGRTFVRESYANAAASGSWKPPRRDSKRVGRELEAWVAIAHYVVGQVAVSPHDPLGIFASAASAPMVKEYGAPSFAARRTALDLALDTEAPLAAMAAMAVAESGFADLAGRTAGPMLMEPTLARILNITLEGMQAAALKIPD